MGKVIKTIVAIIVISLLIVIVGVMFQENNNRLEIVRTTSEQKAYQTTAKLVEEAKNYYIETEKLETNTFMDVKVNEYVDSIILNFKEENSTDSKVKDCDRAVLTNNIDSFKVTDELCGIRVTSNLKKLNSYEYATLIKTFNFNLATENEVKLDDLFKKGYTEVITQDAECEFLLTDKYIAFYNDQVKYEVEYNKLKEYVKSNTLTASNLKMTEAEFEEFYKNRVDPSKKMVAITFDDGPHATNTQQILDILDKYNARATFFMLGQNAKLYPDVVQAVYDQDCEIGLHTWDHPQLTKLSEDAIRQQIDSTSDAIFEITGYRPTIIRPPYGAMNDKVKSVLSDYSLIIWNIDSLDWKSRDENKIVPLVMGDVSDGDIILLHDIHATTVPAAEKIIAQLVEQEYQLVTVSELIEAKGYDRTKTQVFYSGKQ